MNTTLRTRLLLAILGTIVVVLCMTQYGLYAMIRRQLYSEFDQLLGAKARALATMIEQDQDVIDIEFQDHQMQEFARGVRPEYYQVWHEDGSVLAASRQLHDFQLPRLRGDRVVPVLRSVTLPDGRPGRAAGIRFLPAVDGETLAHPEAASLIDSDDDDQQDLDDVDFSNRVYVTLVVAKDTLDIQQSLAGFAWLLFASGAVATLAILGILAWLVSHQLRPLQTLAGQISSVDERRLSRRFELADAPGELQPVVSRLNELMTRLESAFLREKTFTADVAHELRTPLAGIRTTLEVGLSRSRDSASYRAAMEKCLRISEETETIISTLLSLSRIEAGLATLDNDLVDVCSFLRRVWKPYACRVLDKDVDVTWCCDESFVLNTDRDKLQVAISNLFDNATSYVNDGGAIRIDTRLDDEWFEVQISNTGCGLTGEQVEHVFERFWRADTARSATGTHSGLGLALTERIVQFLDGRLSARVVEGRFCLTVLLPAAQVSLSTDEDEASDAVPGDASVAQVGVDGVDLRNSTGERGTLVPRLCPQIPTNRGTHVARSP